MSSQAMQRDPNLRLDLKTGCRWGVKGLVQEAKVQGFARNGCLRGTVGRWSLSSHEGLILPATRVSRASMGQGLTEVLGEDWCPGL